jgi:hypothetical protein
VGTSLLGCSGLMDVSKGHSWNGSDIAGQIPGTWGSVRSSPASTTPVVAEPILYCFSSEGLLGSLLKLLGIEAPTPDHTTEEDRAACSPGLNTIAAVPSLQARFMFSTTWPSARRSRRDFASAGRHR